MRIKSIGIVVISVVGILELGVTSAYAGGQLYDYDEEKYDSFDEFAADCRSSGAEDGKNGPFDHDKYDVCGKYYYDVFIEECMSVEGNTRGICESSADA